MTRPVKIGNVGTQNLTTFPKFLQPKLLTIIIMAMKFPQLAYNLSGYIIQAIYIRFHKQVTFQGFHGYKYMKKAGRKYPDRLADSCKCSSVNQMTAGSSGASWIFSPACNFSNIYTVLNSTSLAVCRTWCPTSLQHLCCKP